ncbi:hypothetical protein Tco_0745382 [Tanacetum coccineum]
MRTRNSNFPNNLNVTILKRQNKGRAPNIVEPELRTIVEVAPMAERTMEELLRAPTEGYGEVIVLPEINANHFEIKINLLQLVQANPFHGYERENPHAHINSFKRLTSTLRFRDVPNDVIKLMMFPYSLEGNARLWYEKEPPNSILTWEGLETFSEAWKRFKEMLRPCPHHGFTELTQVDTFFNGLNENDQDSLNAAVGGNLLSKTTREALNIIENKSKVRYSRNKSNVSRMNTRSRENVSKTDKRIEKLADQLSTLLKQKKGAKNLITVHLSPTIIPRLKIRGQMRIKGQDGQFNGSNTCWQSYTSSNSPHWSITSKNDTLAGVEAQRMMGFVLKALTEVAQMSQSRIATLAIRVRSFGDLTV